MNTVLISINGLCGSGKTTASIALADHLKSKGVSVQTISLYKNEVPKSRILIKTAKFMKLHEITDCSPEQYKMLMEAMGLRLAFDEYAMPAIENNQVVLFDRYTDTYMIDFASYPPAKEILDTFPKCDLSLMMDVDFETAEKRIAQRGREMAPNISDYQKRRIKYNNDVLKKEDNCHVIDATRNQDEVIADVINTVENLLLTKLQKRKKVLMLGYYSENCVSKIAELCSNTVYLNSRDDEAVLKEITDTDIVIIRSPFVLDKQMIACAYKLKLIIRAGSGTDGISPLYKEKGIRLETIKKNHCAVAELVIGQAINALRLVSRACDSVRRKEWLKNEFVGRTLMGKKVGIIGFGNIGRRTAELMSAFSTEILIFDRNPEKPEKQAVLNKVNGEITDFDKLLSISDVIIISVILSDETALLINDETLRKVKNDAVIINVSRGGVVDDNAMSKFLKTNNNAVYVTDVYSKEPISQENMLVGLPNFIGTPHIGAQTFETRAAIEDEIINIMAAYESGD